MTGGRAIRDLLIVGSGGYARETAAAVHAVNGQEPTYRLLGYLDDNPATHGTRPGGVSVLGPPSMVDGHPDAAVLVCVASPRNGGGRARLVQRLGLPAYRYATVIHPSAAVGAGCTVGPGTVLLAHTALTADVTVGGHVAVMPQCVLTHDNVVEQCATLASGARLGGAVRIGEGAYVGAGALIRENVTIGAGALVGMGAVVLGDIPAGEVWIGSPARRLRPAQVPAGAIQGSD
jgi:sugar O-acyltransferase (sialic acid O-acetyltransferase NeuD family)